MFVKSPHPASMILLGLAVLVAASSLDGFPLLFGVLVIGLLALAASGLHLRLLLRGSRWLLLSMFFMFGWMTPGTPLPYLPGASQEGLLLAGENMARLLIALAMVAVLLRVLASPELVAGMRALLSPLVLLGISRDRIAVRMALTLNAVEASRVGQRGGVELVSKTLALPAPTLGLADLVIASLSGALVLSAWL